MVNNDIQTELLYFLIAAIIFIIAIFIIFKIFNNNFKINNKNIKYYGILLNLNTPSLISISSLTINYLFIVFCTLSFRGINIIYISIILLLTLISEAVIDNFKGLITSIPLAAINCAAIEMVNRLFIYIYNESFSLLLLIILFLLILFIFLYDTYNLFRSINNVIVKNKYLKDKKYNI